MFFGGASTGGGDVARTIVVTGAGSGIGAACAMRFAQAGWNVAGGIYDEGQRPTVDRVAEAAGTAGGRAIGAILDVTDEASCKALVGEAVGAFGGVDALVNAAGISRIVALKEIESLTVADFRNIYEVNLIGTFLMCRAAASALKRSKDAAIVNLSSQAAHSGGGSSIAYAASKGAVSTLTRSLARALAPEVRVNAVAPALVEGGFLQRLDPPGFEPRRARQIERAPLARVGQPADVAETIYWLITAAPLVTGAELPLDCGLRIAAD
jgi:3-oxoacyl-[acyl-carrier protein] reductase